jgi:hypothetical protein
LIRDKLLVDNTLTFYRFDKMRSNSDNDLDSLHQLISTDVFLKNEEKDL